MNSIIKESRLKVVNDPVYGFITIPNSFIQQLLEHPYFQRLRNINQLGLTNLVYPGANHTRFQHALGALHLMQQAIETLRKKGVDINNDEANAVFAAILLHDIGHGPFSHALENSLVEHVNHEDISALMMRKLNAAFDGKLDLTIEIFNNRYPKKFLHQLVSSQLDMDRLDYLMRDSFFSGVSEGVIGSGRIIKMLDVSNNSLVVESKGIYSIEKFLVSRRLMYWQVYLHRTVLAAEFLLLNILRRAKFLALQGKLSVENKYLKIFLEKKIDKTTFLSDESYLMAFSKLDDSDISSAIKLWCDADDQILRFSCQSLVYRRLFKAELQNTDYGSDYKMAILEKIKNTFQLSEEDAKWLLLHQQVKNNAYNEQDEQINIIYKDGTVKNIGEAADILNISALSKDVFKYMLAYPKKLI